MSQETVMLLACGAAAEQGDAFYMSDKVTRPCTNQVVAGGYCAGGSFGS